MTEMSEMTLSSIICKNESMIQFDKDIIPSEFINWEGIDVATLNMQNAKFGVVNLKINKKDPIIQKRHFVFTVDCSGSMSDICNDSRSKMDHSNHTLINMITYFAEHPELLVSVTVFAFDGSIYNIIINQKVTEQNLDEVVKSVKKIRPKDLTNIEKALLNSKEYIATYIENNAETHVCHIFMTDGDATDGATIPSKLKEYVNPLIPNVFIGFGIEHNAYLLKELASDNKNSYYFVDELEKAGLVYGEILHSIIYRVLETTKISLVNGLIYDWKKNIWVDKIYIGDLISESNKIFHVLSNNPSEFECTFQTTHCITKEIYDFTIQNLHEYKKVDTIEDGFVILTQYKYRQRTQQLLFEVNEYNFDKVKNDETWGFNRSNDTHIDTEDSFNSIKLKEKMKSLLKEMQEFLDNTTVIADSSFIKLLCDDLYICLKTFDTKHSAMFSCARQLSQGAQRAYSATRTPKAPINRHVFDIENYGTPIFERTNAGNYNDNGSLISKFPDFNIDELNDDNFNKEFYQIINDSDNDNNNDNDNDIEYNLSSADDNPYSTLSISDLMRSCSKNSK